MEDITYDIAGKSDISELVRLRIAYMYDDFGEVSDSELKAMNEQLPGYFEEHLGDDLIAFVARADGGSWQPRIFSSSISHQVLLFRADSMVRS